MLIRSIFWVGSARWAPDHLGWTWALGPLTVLLGIVAQLLTGDFQIAGRPAGTTPRRIPPLVQGFSLGCSRRGPCTAPLTPRRFPRGIRHSCQSQRSEALGTGRTLRAHGGSSGPAWQGNFSLKRSTASCSCGGRLPSALSSERGQPPRRSERLPTWILR